LATASYIAAVATHTSQTGSSVEEVIQKNLAIFGEHVSVAKTNGANIIVFPEFAISNPEMFKNRTVAVQFAEQVSVGGNLCGKVSSPILSALSCLAKKFSILIVANMNEVKGANLYNTDVVFDETGTLISTYRKTHVWFTDIYDTPSSPTVTNFTTTFGVDFGLMICYDIAFDNPGVQLVDRGVKHFPYSVSQGIVGPLIVRAWTLLHSATIISANLGTHTGIYRHGGSVDGTHYPLSGSGDSVFVATVPYP